MVPPIILGPGRSPFPHWAWAGPQHTRFETVIVQIYTLKLYSYVNVILVTPNDIDITIPKLLFTKWIKEAKQSGHEM